MGCINASVPAPADKPPTKDEYDERWNDLRERYQLGSPKAQHRLAPAAEDGDEDLEPGRCGYAMSRKYMAIRGAFVLKMHNVTFRPIGADLQNKNDKQHLSSGDKAKIRNWMESMPDMSKLVLPGNKLAESPINQSLDPHNRSVHTIYSMDDDEELVVPENNQGFSKSPQRLSDKRAINRLQNQLKDRDRREQKGKDKEVKGDASAPTPEREMQALLEIAPPVPNPPPAGLGVDKSAEATANGPSAPPPGVPGTPEMSEVKAE